MSKENLEIKEPEKFKNNIVIKKDGKEYIISTVLKISKYEQYLENAKKGNYEEAFCELISDSDTNITELSQNEKKQIIRGIIENNNLQEYYEKIEEEDLYKKLYVTLKTYRVEMRRGIGEVVSNLTKGITELIKPLIRINYDKIVEGIKNTLGDFQKSLNTFLDGVLKNIPNKKETRRIRRNYKKWGKYGWTILPNAPIYFFNDCPSKQSEADEICMNQIEEKELKNITTYIYKNIKYRKKFAEAIKCYNSEFYLATAMILTSLIERKLTELPMQSKADKKARGKAIIDKYKESLNIEDVGIIEVYYSENIFSYLDMFLKDGKDFKRQRFNVNRNFLMHGWRDIRTTRTDCIKLFLALYNIILLWENKK